MLRPGFFLAEGQPKGCLVPKHSLSDKCWPHWGGGKIAWVGPRIGKRKPKCSICHCVSDAEEVQMPSLRSTTALHFFSRAVNSSLQFWMDETTLSTPGCGGGGPGGKAGRCAGVCRLNADHAQWSSAGTWLLPTASGGIWRRSLCGSPRTCLLYLPLWPFAHTTPWCFVPFNDSRKSTGFSNEQNLTIWKWKKGKSFFYILKTEQGKTLTNWIKVNKT